MARKFEIAPGRWIGDGHPCYVIAEIGQNHQGDMEVAKQLIEIASECGVDCVKFQKSDFEAKFTSAVLNRPYNSPHAFGATYGEHKKFLEFSGQQYQVLKNYAESMKVHFTASAMDEVSIDFLVNLGVPFIKIGSGDANNFEFLEKAAKTELPIVYSTGMQDLETVDRAVSLMRAINPKICVLQCTSSYPTPDDEVHLKVMQDYRDRFPGCPVGYSGHEDGLPITLAAAALGAHVIERHITLDKTWKGNDHACSLDPTELRSLVEGIRRIEKAMGSPIKARQPSEEPCHQKLGKSVVTARPLAAGTRLSRDDLTVKVGHPLGWSPEHLDQLYGRLVLKDLDGDETVTADCVQ